MHSRKLRNDTSRRTENSLFHQLTTFDDSNYYSNTCVCLRACVRACDVRGWVRRLRIGLFSHRRTHRTYQYSCLISNELRASCSNASDLQRESIIFNYEQFAEREREREQAIHYDHYLSYSRVLNPLPNG